MNNLVVLLAIQIIVSIILIVWVRLKVMRSLDDGDSIARVRREIGALIIELDGSADRNITVIEDRLRELKDCIAEADKRIVMLSNERARASAAPNIPLQQVYRTPTQASQPPVQVAQPPVQVPLSQTPSIPFIRFSEKPLVFEEPFAERVARLHKRGFSSDIIAAKLKATIAEVDLAIAAGGNPTEGRGEG
ncbi:MAG: hypothetical protein ABIJ86_07355 [Spirochaetota bacterium]